MAGLATVTARISSDINRGSDFDSRIKQAIENSIKFYRARRYQFNSRRAGLTISTEYQSFSDEIFEIDYFKIVVTGSNYQKELWPENYLVMNRKMVDISLSAEPVYYGRDGNEFRFYPPPDQSYSAEIHYLIDFREVSVSASDSASNAWLVQGEELIRTHAMIEVLEMYVDGDDALKKADRARMRELQIEAELKRRAAKSQGSGLIRGVI